MAFGGDDEYWVPGCVREYLRSLGFSSPLEDMEPWIRSWYDWMGARGSFYDYRDTDGMGRVYEVHRRSIHPAMRICREWGSLLLNEKVKVACEDQGATDWLDGFLTQTGFMAQAQSTVVRAFGLGTGAWALWVDVGRRKVRIRHYDARMVIPLTWDEDGVTECAFVTRAYLRGKPVDQLQMHLRGGAGPSPSDGGSSGDTYRIVTVCFDHEGNRVEPAGVVGNLDTGSTWPTFSIVKPTIANTRVDMSPYGQSVFADATDAVQAVDLTFDALVNEVDVSKMRVFLSDVLFDREQQGDRTVTIPFGKSDCTVFRCVMSTEDTIQEFAPALRTEQQARALGISLQTLGDLCGLGLNYFDFDGAGYVKTATSDNSALMRNIRRHENGLEVSLSNITHALMAACRRLGEGVPEEGGVRAIFDDSIVQDTDALKQRDLEEVKAGLMLPWEYRRRWYGEDEATAKARAREDVTPAGA